MADVVFEIEVIEAKVPKENETNDQQPDQLVILSTKMTKKP